MLSIKDCDSAIRSTPITGTARCAARAPLLMLPVLLAAGVAKSTAVLDAAAGAVAVSLSLSRSLSSAAGCGRP